MTEGTSRSKPASDRPGTGPSADCPKALEGKVVVVVGAAGLLGRSFVRGIVDAGGVTVAADFNQTGAEELAWDLGPWVHAMQVDVTDETSVALVISQTKSRAGRLDAVVNCSYPRNANYGRKLEEVRYNDFCDNLGKHLGGYFLVSQQFCRAFREQGWGNLVNISSIYGVIPPRFDIYQGTAMTMPVEYAAIKSGLIHLTRYFAQYYKKCGIRANCISPGGILANQPSSFLDAYNNRCSGKGMLDPEDLVAALIFLLSDSSRHVTGQNLIVDDGFSL